MYTLVQLQYTSLLNVLYLLRLHSVVKTISKYNQLDISVLVPNFGLIDVCFVGFKACISSPCQHNGQCDITSKGFQCRCNGTYDGPTCSGMYCAISAGVDCSFHRNTRARTLDLFFKCKCIVSQKQMGTR